MATSKKIEKAKGEYVVENILAMDVVGTTKFYLVKWLNYKLEESTWEPERNLSKCHPMVNAFESGVEFGKQVSTGKNIRFGTIPGKNKKSKEPSRGHSMNLRSLSKSIGHVALSACDPSPSSATGLSVISGNVNRADYVAKLLQKGDLGPCHKEPIVKVMNDKKLMTIILKFVVGDGDKRGLLRLRLVSTLWKEIAFDLFSILNIVPFIDERFFNRKKLKKLLGLPLSVKVCVDSLLDRASKQFRFVSDHSNNIVRLWTGSGTKSIGFDTETAPWNGLLFPRLTHLRTGCEDPSLYASDDTVHVTDFIEKVVKSSKCLKVYHISCGGGSTDDPNKQGGLSFHIETTSISLNSSVELYELTVVANGADRIINLVDLDINHAFGNSQDVERISQILNKTRRFLKRARIQIPYEDGDNLTIVLDGTHVLEYLNIQNAAIDTPHGQESLACVLPRLRSLRLGWWTPNNDKIVRTVRRLLRGQVAFENLTTLQIKSSWDAERYGRFVGDVDLLHDAKEYFPKVPNLRWDLVYGDAALTGDVSKTRMFMPEDEFFEYDSDDSSL